MSDEESFVILGSSPLSSLEVDGIESRKDSITSLDSDTPGSRFTSLRSSQISNVKNSQEIGEIEPQKTIPSMIISTNVQNSLSQMTESIMKTTKEFDKNDEISASKIWNKTPLVHVEENMMPLSLEDCAVKYPLEQQQQQSIKVVEENLSTSINEEHSSLSKKTTPPTQLNKNLAASFLMGEVNSEVLKTSVYSQFPSLSMEACPEDVLKLQNMVTEYSELKATIKKANNTMKLFYNNSLQWKDKMNTIEQQYKEQLEKCQNEIEELRGHNMQIEDNFRKQIQALEVAREKDRLENIKEISEKNAVLENMRAQIIKLEQQQLSSFEYVLKNNGEEQNEQFNKLYMTHSEHELKIKNLQRSMSEMLASNLDLKDMEKQYIDELNCLKVNLTSAEELIKKNVDEVRQLSALNEEKQKQLENLEISLKSMQLAFEEQKERVSLLETQNEVHRTDFEMEKQSRETAVKEKQQILQDLRSLQKRNQELIEEHQKMTYNYQRKLSANGGNNDSQIAAAAAAAQSYLNNPQRPIRSLPSPSTSAASPPVAMHVCPVCNKAFKSLNILLCHVNDCVDKN